MRHRTGALAVGLAVTAALVAASAAVADPSVAKSHNDVVIKCGSQTFTTVTIGPYTWTPAHLVDSNALFLTVAFSEVAGVVTLPDGTTIPIADPPVEKGNGNALPPSATIVDCTFVNDTEIPGGPAFYVTGKVRGYIVGG
jgi:hypothetical protein